MRVGTDDWMEMLGPGRRPSEKTTFSPAADSFFSPPLRLPPGATEQIALSAFITSHQIALRPPPHLSLLPLPPPHPLSLSEDHKWLHARSHLFDSPTGAFMSPFILSSSWLTGWRRPLPPLCLAQRSGRQPHAAKPLSHCYFSSSWEDVSGFDIAACAMTMRPTSDRTWRPTFFFLSFFSSLALIGSDVSAQTQDRNEMWTLCWN